MNSSPGGTRHLGLVLFWSAVLWTSGCDGEEMSGCYGDTVTISCGSGDKKINILGDFYGLSPPDAGPRVCAYSDRDICVIPSHSHSSVVKQVCNGRTNCIFTISEKHTCVNSVKETTYQQIKYECIPESEIRSMCDEAEWSSHSGFLMSANYPIFYPPRASCTCTLHTKDASFILLKTAELRLKAASPCRDFLRVEPALNPEEYLCGSTHRIYEARSFTLHFHSQLSAYKGFLLSYEASSLVKIRCSSRSPYTTTTPTAATSNMTSPGLTDVTPKPRPETLRSSVTPDSGGATYRPTEEPAATFPPDLSPSIKVPVASLLHTVSGCFGDIVHFQCKDGELIRIIQDMYGTAPSGRCTYEPGDCAVEAVGQKSIVSQICSSKTRCMNFIVTRTFCGERVTSYQEISYECVPATALTDVCSETVMSSSHGFLASPNFPGMYPRNLSCSCTLRAAHREGDAPGIVRVALAHFTLHDLLGCEDWLEVDLGDGNPPRTLCGSQHGHFSGTSIRLHFRSDAQHSHAGFWLDFEGENETMIVVACNVPVQLVWPNDVTVPPSTTPTTTTTTTTTTSRSPAAATTPYRNLNRVSDSAISQIGDNTSKTVLSSENKVNHHHRQQQVHVSNMTSLFNQNDIDNGVDAVQVLRHHGGSASARSEEVVSEFNFRDRSFEKEEEEEEEEEEISSVEDDVPLNETVPEKDQAKPEMQGAMEEEDEEEDEMDVTVETPAVTSPSIVSSSSGDVQRVITGWMLMAPTMALLV